MNADNVKPYGKLVHEAAEAGGVDAFCDAIENNGYLKGASDKEDELIPYLITMGIIAVGETAILCYKGIKSLINRKSDKKASAELEAEKAREELETIINAETKEGDLDNEKNSIS